MRSTRASRVTRSLAAGTLCVLVVAGVVRSRARPGSGHVAPAAGPRPSADARVRFEANHGQFDDRVSFAARGPGYGLFLTPDGATLTLQRRTRTAGSVRRAAAVDTAVLRMRVVGGQPVTPSASEPLLAVSNYFVGKDRSKWRVGVESFARVRYAAVRPGLDVVFHGSGERALEYDLVLAPRVDPSEVALVFQGADGTAVGPGGELVLRTRGGEIRQPPPVAYQEGAGTERTPVAARYVAQADGAIGFAVGPYDRERALVIDPILVYSTYLGGTDEDLALDIAVDGSGNVYVAGTTLSTNFPVVAAAQPIYGGGFTDVFVTKLSAAGVPVYSTYLGASDADQAEGIALDANGFIYVTGVTSSIDFPIRNAFQSSLNGPSDAFLVELDAGGAIVRSTFLGGSSDDIGVGVAPDGAGGIIVGGMTDSTDFPTASAVQATPGGMGDAFVTRFDAGGALVYSTYLGGGALDSVNGLAADASGQAYVTGFTQSTDFPVASAFQPTNHTTDPVNGGNGFVTKLSATGTFVYSTYLGGSNSDSGDGIRTDGAGAAYLVGQTSSLDFPTASAFQPTHHGGQWDAFVAKLDASGTPVFSTFLGGSGRDFGRKIALDSAGAVLVTGFTQSPDFPVLGSIQAPRAGYDAFVTKLKPGGGALAYSTYLGGDGDEFAEALAVDAAGAAYVAGSTSSTNFPTRLPFQPTNHGGQSDAFVARLSPFTPAAVPAGSKTTIALLALLLVAVSIRLLGRRPPGRA